MQSEILCQECHAEICVLRKTSCGCVENQLGMGMAIFCVHGDKFGGIVAAKFKIMITWTVKL